MDVKRQVQCPACHYGRELEAARAERPDIPPAEMNARMLAVLVAASAFANVRATECSKEPILGEMLAHLCHSHAGGAERALEQMCQEVGMDFLDLGKALKAHVIGAADA